VRTNPENQLLSQIFLKFNSPSISVKFFPMDSTLKYNLQINSELDENQLETVLNEFKFKTVKRKTLLLSAGEICNKLYYIEKGSLRIYYLTKQGKEKTRSVAFEGSLVTSTSSFITQQPSFEFIESLEDSELWAIDNQAFFQFVSDMPKWDKFYRTLLEKAYIFQNKVLESLITLTAKQRFEQVQKENPMFIKRLQNRILASYLNISQETLSRLKSV
jgi:CRP-like cAMP-binding protein